MTGGFARTAVNVEAGAKSQVSAVVSAGLILTAVNCLTSFFYYIPMSSLAAIVQVWMGLVHVQGLGLLSFLSLSSPPLLKISMSVFQLVVYSS